MKHATTTAMPLGFINADAPDVALDPARFIARVIKRTQASGDEAMTARLMMVLCAHVPYLTRDHLKRGVIGAN